MSDRIAVMRAGRVEQVGTPVEIYDTPASAFVARFIGSANLVPVLVEATHNGRARLRLPGGRRSDVETSGRAFEAGARALLMIRPERLALGDALPEPERCALEVTCTDLVFQGAALRCALRDVAGGELVAYLEASRQEPAARPGAKLWLSFDPAAARLLHAEAEPAAPAAADPAN